MKKLILTLALLLPIPAVAQQYEPGLFRPLTLSQVLAIDTTNRTATRQIINNGPLSIQCTTSCWIAMGYSTSSNISPVASSTTGSFVASGIPYFFYGTSGMRISVMANTSTGLAIIQEMIR